MSLWRDITDNLKKIVLMEDKIDRMVDDVTALGRTVDDHEKRLIRIETMIELAQSNQNQGRLPPA